MLPGQEQVAEGTIDGVVSGLTCSAATKAGLTDEVVQSSLSPLETQDSFLNCGEILPYCSATFLQDKTPKF